nr:hypothetical protein [Pandoravirus aubagnensis]
MRRRAVVRPEATGDASVRFIVVVVGGVHGVGGTVLPFLLQMTTMAGDAGIAGQRWCFFLCSLQRAVSRPQPAPARRQTHLLFFSPLAGTCRPCSIFGEMAQQASATRAKSRSCPLYLSLFVVHMFRGGALLPSSLAKEKKRTWIDLYDQLKEARLLTERKRKETFSVRTDKAATTKMNQSKNDICCGQQWHCVGR